MLFAGTLRHLGRTRQIIRVLLKYGFEDLVTNTPLQNLVPRRLLLNWMRENRNVYESTRWERIRMACEELGPTFIKLAQILSNRPDLLPEPLILELRKLQSQVAPFPFSDVERILSQELGRSHELVFENIEETPLGSASIGQVHRAKLLNGEDVVIKVRRPGVSKLMHLDLEIVRYFVHQLEGYLKEQGIINAMDAVDAFEKSMYKELDYKNEARNVENFRNFYRNHHNFYVPRAYKEYTTERVMVIEYTDGCKITDLQQIREWELNPEHLAEQGMDIYLTQIFEFGYFHADPHPGNVLVREDGTICLIDFGMVGKLMRRDKHAFASVFIAMSRQDAKSMAINLRRLALEDDIEDIRALEYDLHEIIEDYATLDVSESSIEDLINRLQAVMYNYKMRVPGSVFLIFRALAVLEGIGKQIHPHFNVSEFIRPYGRKVFEEQFSPKNISEEVFFRIGSMFSFLNSIPLEVKTILKKTRQGKLRIEIEPKAYDPFMRKMDRVTNRMILTLVIISLVLGSSIAMTAPFPEKHISPVLGIPYISLFGLSVAVFLSVILLFAVLRTRKL